MQGFRRAAIHLALIALILRGFLPTGWMPNPEGPDQTAFVICTMDGPVQSTDGKTLPRAKTIRAPMNPVPSRRARPCPAH